jgi:hypothetical protein
MYDNLKDIGTWFSRKFKSLAEQEIAAGKALQKCPENAEVLKDQWRLQIESQTKTTPRTYTQLVLQITEHRFRKQQECHREADGDPSFASSRSQGCDELSG